MQISRFTRMVPIVSRFAAIVPLAATGTATARSAPPSIGRGGRPSTGRAVAVAIAACEPLCAVAGYPQRRSASKVA